LNADSLARTIKDLIMIQLLILLKCLKHQHDHCFFSLGIGKDVFVVVGVGLADDVVGVTVVDVD